MRPRAGLNFRKLQDTHALPLYSSIYDGVQMYKELKDELNNLHDAHDADEHERAIERMREELLPDNCSG
eukprot:3530542-Pleurochrysis_carterae.AAC.1